MLHRSRARKRHRIACHSPGGADDGRRHDRRRTDASKEPASVISRLEPRARVFRRTYSADANVEQANREWGTSAC